MSFSFSLSYLDTSLVFRYLSLILVSFSIVFLWWMNLNMLGIPSLFLYVDFFVPLFFFVMLLLLLFVGFKFFLKELSFKFLGDYLPKLGVIELKYYKLLDMILNGLNFNGVRFFLLVGK